MSTLDAESIKVLPVAGSSVLNANMTAIIYKKSIYLVDSGKGGADPSNKVRVLTPRTLSRREDVIPRFDIMNSYLEDGATIQAVFITHIHADHTGSLKELCEYLDSWNQKPTFYASRIVETMMKHLRVGYKHSAHVQLVSNQQFYTTDGNLKITPIEVNHSTQGTMALVIQSKKRRLMYLPDFVPDYSNNHGADQHKLDQKFEEIGAKGLDAIICQSTIASKQADQIPLSEEEVCARMKNHMSYYHLKKKGLIVTGFMTNCTRTCVAIEHAISLGRPVLTLGRSTNSLVDAYFELGLLDPKLRSRVTDMKKMETKKIIKSRYVIITTGHQGEYDAGLTRIARDEIRLNIGQDDVILICSTTIPKIGPIVSRADLKNHLLQRRVEVVEDIHKSGHITGTELSKVVLRLKPKKIIANHGDLIEQAGWYKIAASINVPLDIINLGVNGQVIQV